jgi:predicted RNA binding protein with dsRBD fold (UPF0201 family)
MCYVVGRLIFFSQNGWLGDASIFLKIKINKNQRSELLTWLGPLTSINLII